MLNYSTLIRRASYIMAITAFLDDIKDTEQREATDYIELLKDTREQKKTTHELPFPFLSLTIYFNTLMQCYLVCPHTASAPM